MNLLKNIQFQQLINLFLLLLIAKFNNTLQTDWAFVVLLSLYALIFESTINYYTLNKIYIPYSAIITAFGVILMVGWLKWYIPFIIIALALLQKRFLTIEQRHIFNPSNFALIVAILLFYPKASPIIGELGYQGYFTIYAVLILSIFILIRVNRLTVAIAFIIFYTLLEYLILGSSDPMWHIDDFLTKFYTTSFIVYTLFMLTDPITTPNSFTKQLIFGASTATLAVTLDYFIGQKVWNLFLALFLSSILTIQIYRKVEKKECVKYLVVLILSITVAFIICSKKAIYFSM